MSTTTHLFVQNFFFLYLWIWAEQVLLYFLSVFLSVISYMFLYQYVLTFIFVVIILSLSICKQICFKYLTKYEQIVLSLPLKESIALQVANTLLQITSPIRQCKQFNGKNGKVLTIEKKKFWCKINWTITRALNSLTQCIHWISI